ncbi:hypothetical protein GGR26_002547 [Lewinella marina]|uniref:Uncharacterized protein n=1 Tax=Neolewinella marina TaxID=438751 RepID=A0A2G0CC85_9BACT|nr:hypothetical protein [Neolewinella marina]NJB86770.1 hypothetical protein [Neolewinella marina]PHK97575.1 hypothetical protein CGL56_15880 [Neolewinella marina]
MIPDYHFRADHSATGTARWIYLLLYAGAALLLVAAVYELYLYFTHWAIGDERDHVWQLILGILYLVVSGLVAYFTSQRHGREETPPERFVTIKDGILTYQLDQLNGKQRVDLRHLVATRRPSVRDLTLELKDGQRVELPIYLIDDEAKQAELEKILVAAAR